MLVDTFLGASALPSNVLAWILTYALHSTVLFGGAWLTAVVAARIACRVPRVRDLLPSIRERLWKVALVGGLITATVQTSFHVGPWQMRFAPEISPNSRITLPEDISTVRTAPQPSMRDAVAKTVDAQVGVVRAVADEIPLQTAATSSASARSIDSATWIRVVLALWMLGVAVGLARWICQWNRLLRELDDRTPIHAGILFDALERLRSKAGSRTRVTLSSAPSIAAPMTLGLRRLEICVPPRVETELRREEIDALLAHELAHAERRDPLWLVVCRAVEVLFFFQPLNRVCAVWLADEAEYLADDWAVTQTGERVGLASCLTEIAGWMVQADESRLVAGMAARGTRLTLRVGRLLDEEHEPATSARGTWMTGAFAPCGLAAALLVPGVTTADEPSRARDFLADRATRLEFELVSLAKPAVAETDASRTSRAEAGVDASADPDLDAVLRQLDLEIERLRDELSSRVGGESLGDALDALQSRVGELRARACRVQNELNEMTALEWNTTSDAGALANEHSQSFTPKD